MQHLFLKPRSIKYLVLSLFVLGLLVFSKGGLWSQTMGLASALHIPNQGGDVEQTLALRLVSEIEDGVLGYFFDNGFIGFNIPPLYILPQEVDLPANEPVRGVWSRKENLQFINLAASMRQGGASQGVVVQAQVEFLENPPRAVFTSLELSLIDLSEGEASMAKSLRTVNIPAKDQEVADIMKPLLRHLDRLMNEALGLADAGTGTGLATSLASW